MDIMKMLINSAKDALKNVHYVLMQLLVLNVKELTDLLTYQTANVTQLFLMMEIIELIVLLVLTLV